MTLLSFFLLTQNAKNVENMKPVQNCTGFIFFAFQAAAAVHIH